MTFRQFVNNLKLRTKIIVPVLLMLVLSSFATGTYLIKKQAEGIRRELETAGETMIRMLAVNAETGVILESKYDLDELLTIMRRFNWRVEPIDQPRELLTTRWLGVALACCSVLSFLLLLT